MRLFSDYQNLMIKLRNYLIIVHTVTIRYNIHPNLSPHIKIKVILKTKSTVIIYLWNMWIQKKMLWIYYLNHSQLLHFNKFTEKNRFVNVFNSKGSIVEIIVQMLIDTTNAANDNKGWTIRNYRMNIIWILMSVFHVFFVVKQT